MSYGGGHMRTAGLMKIRILIKAAEVFNIHKHLFIWLYSFQYLWSSYCTKIIGFSCFYTDNWPIKLNPVMELNN